MAKAMVNGVTLYYELHGAGLPLALVHGSWTDCTQWRSVVPGLAESYQVLVYDRRGHSRSERPNTQGSLDEDGDDLTALLEALDLAPAHIVANSLGSNIALRLAARRPAVFRSLTCHEPPLPDLLDDDVDSRRSARSLESVGRRIAAGDHEGAARQFVDEVVLGPGAWDNGFPADAKQTFIRNAPTFLDELRSAPFGLDTDGLANLDLPIWLTEGSDSPPLWVRVLDRLEQLLPRVRRELIKGAAHLPHVTTPDRYVEVVTWVVRQT